MRRVVKLLGRFIEFPEEHTTRWANVDGTPQL
jgi:hypothetical protein